MEYVALKPNDVIELKPGMAVGYHHFENIFYAAGTTSGSSSGKVIIDHVYKGRGDAWQVRINLRNRIYDCFKEEGRKVDDDILLRFLEHQVRDSNPRTFSIPSGYYIVTRVVTDGQQRRVYCKTYQINETRPEIEVFFFQVYHADASMKHDNLQPLKI